MSHECLQEETMVSELEIHYIVLLKHLETRNKIRQLI